MLGQNILVIGDFMIDQSWIISGASSPTAQAHGDIKPMKRIHPMNDDERLGGAGMSVSAIQTLCNRNNVNYKIHGIGLWNKKDDNLFLKLAKDSNEELGCQNIELHRLEVENEDDIVTTIKSRFYQQSAEDQPRLGWRFDQDPDPKIPPILKKTPLPNDSLPKDVRAIWIADFNKGTITKELLSVLYKIYGVENDCFWFMDSKNDRIYDLMPEKLRLGVLTMNREEAVKLMNNLCPDQISTIPHGKQPNVELISLLKNLKKELIEKRNDVQFKRIVIKLDSEGACLTDCQDRNEDTFLVHPKVGLDIEGIAAGDFFNASLLLDILSNKTEPPRDDFGDMLKNACGVATEWLQFNKVYFSSNLVENKKSDIVKPHYLPLNKTLSVNYDNYRFVLSKKLEELQTPLKYPEILGNEKPVIDLTNAKGFLGEFISTDVRLRQQIRAFVDNIREYLQSPNITIPLNCLVTAKPGFGKSFFAKQIANETNCGLVEVNCSQITSERDLLEQIAQLQSVNEQKAPLLFLDEANSNSKLYRLLLAPLWDSQVVIDGHVRRWRQKTVVILVISIDKGEFEKKLQDEDKGPDLLSRLNGPDITLMETSLPNAEMLTSRVYVVAQMLKKHFPDTVRVVERGLMDLAYCANYFNPRGVEQFLITLPSPIDGVVSLKGVHKDQLEKYVRNLGYTINDSMHINLTFDANIWKRFKDIGYDNSSEINIKNLKEEHVRLTESKRSKTE
jgi:hypothetical protein